MVAGSQLPSGLSLRKQSPLQLLRCVTCLRAQTHKARVTCLQHGRISVSGNLRRASTARRRTGPVSQHGKTDASNYIRHVYHLRASLYQRGRVEHSRKTAEHKD